MKKLIIGVLLCVSLLFAVRVSAAEIEMVPDTALVIHTVPENRGMKTWMTYRLFGGSSPQQRLQELAYTDQEGFRKVNDRYCVALGSFFTTEIGQCFDLYLENGEIIHCVLGDGKSNKDTDKHNIFTNNSNCCSEFLVDPDLIPDSVKRSGDVSYRTDTWQSPVNQIVVYNINVLNLTDLRKEETTMEKIICFKNGDDATRFVSDVSEFSCDINITDGHIVLDAKSLIAVLTLDFSKEFQVEIISKDQEEIERFASLMEQYSPEVSE